MKQSSSEVFKQALNLGERDRATLAGLLIESLEKEASDRDLEAAWRVEIQRRIKELDSGGVKTIPWGEVKKRLFQQITYLRVSSISQTLSYHHVEKDQPLKRMIGYGVGLGTPIGILVSPRNGA